MPFEPLNGQLAPPDCHIFVEPWNGATLLLSSL
jgi:hypothetical protein